MTSPKKAGGGSAATPKPSSTNISVSPPSTSASRSTSIEETAEGCDGFRWLLLQDPMPGILEDDYGDIGRHESRLRPQRFTERLLSTQSENRDGELRLCEIGKFRCR